VRRRGSHTFLNIRLTDGGKFVSLTRRPPFAPQKDSWYSFMLEAEESTQGHSAAGRIRSIEKSSDLIGNGIRDLPDCSIISSHYHWHAWTCLFTRVNASAWYRNRRYLYTLSNHNKLKIIHGSTSCLLLRRKVKTKEKKIAKFNIEISLVVVICIYVTVSDRNRVQMALNGRCQQWP
jgi:hypothetical protein